MPFFGVCRGCMAEVGNECLTDDGYCEECDNKPAEVPAPDCGHTEECGLCSGKQECRPIKCRFCRKTLCHNCMIDHFHPEITGQPVEVTW